MFFYAFWNLTILHIHYSEKIFYDLTKPSLHLNSMYCVHLFLIEFQTPMANKLINQKNRFMASVYVVLTKSKTASLQE